MTTELLPCPFCGDDGDKGRQTVTMMDAGRATFDRIQCRSCGAMAPELNWQGRAAATTIAMPQSHSQPPAGYALVPIEPTPEMIGAMAVVDASGKINGVPSIGMSGACEAYEAMLAAAPDPSP